MRMQIPDSYDLNFAESKFDAASHKMAKLQTYLSFTGLVIQGYLAPKKTSTPVGTP